MTNQISDFKFAVNPEATASIHDEGIVILHIGNGNLYASNETGARIWCAVERKLCLEAIVEEISGVFKIAMSTAREHTVTFLAELQRQGLIQRKAEL
jgi:UDP-N-acetylglucosamine transferase subunit ALG13